MPNIVKFHDQELTVLDLEGQHWLNAFQIGTGLGFSNPGNAIRKIYHHHKSEFSPDMTTLIELPTATGPKLTRIFSARGAALLAMLAKTDRAAEFRGWVLDVLERTDTSSPPLPGLTGQSRVMDSGSRTASPGMTIKGNGNDGGGVLAVVLTGTKKPCGWDMWPQIARYIAMGLTNREIATLLGRSYGYIKHIILAMGRAGANPRNNTRQALLPKGRAA